MPIETLVIALILFIIGAFVVRQFVPAEFKQIGWAILCGIVVIWVVTHLRALLHCCTTG